MTNTPTVREVLARAISDLIGDEAEEFGPDTVDDFVEKFTQAGIPEAQLNSLLAGEAVVVPKGELAEIEAEAGRLVDQYRVLKKAFDLLQASQESGDG